MPCAVISLSLALGHLTISRVGCVSCLFRFLRSLVYFVVSLRDSLLHQRDTGMEQCSVT